MQFRRPHWAEREKRGPFWLLAGAAPASSRRPGRGRSRLVLASIGSQFSRTADRTGAEGSSLSFARRAVAVPECLGSHPNEALRLMETGRYRHLPIVDDGKVVEIVSRFDFSDLEQDRLGEDTGL